MRPIRVNAYGNAFWPDISLTLPRCSPTGLIVLLRGTLYKALVLLSNLQELYVHPSSVMFNRKAKWVMFHEGKSLRLSGSNQSCGNQ